MEPKDGGRVFVTTADEGFVAKVFRDINFHAVTLPRIRAVGSAMLLVLVAGHNHLVFGERPFGSLAPLALSLAGYCIFSWMLLFFFYRPGSRLGDFFLNADVLWFTVAIYASGGPHSLLYPLLLVRVGDQANTTCRRVLWFAHLIVVSYLGMLVYIDLVTSEPVLWPAQVARLAILYFCGLYLALTAQTAEYLRRQASNAVAAARGLIRTLDQKNAELDRAFAEAEAANRARSRFLAVMSHELRTPLNAVIGFADLLADPSRGVADPRHLHYVETIRSAGWQLLHLVDRILELTQQGSLPLIPQCELVDLNRLLETQVERVRRAAEQRNLRLDLELAQSSPVRLDPARIGEVIHALLDNAIKFTPRGGSIRLRRVPCGEDFVEISVTDSGPGIPSDQQERIFEDFVQLDASNSRRHDGAGLGLALARRCVIAHHGVLLLESREGMGCTFRVRLPAAAPRAQQE
ncbi:MAG: HAMP domain-containing histidine kinase [Armatimonadetes bacterium]|nr:HAMP domain-containing histidine kinase [Armatimonadota bacterium]